MSKKDIRKKFRSEVFKRDDFTCQVCNTKRSEEELDAHHISDRSTMANGGYVASNGITVCKEECHMQVEEFHISDGQEWTPGLHPNNLYEKIGSSKEQADKDSEALA